MDLGLSDDTAASAYQVLARKYRPQNFDDLIGHEAMVRTLKNAFAARRIAHAFILTGVRGVGKTTTARILARALNYVPKEGEDTGPTVELGEEGVHCRAIAESRHPDVMEMDAASRTGVGDIREIIEGVKYLPTSARYKVYIIDEVHMLSTSAFKALLKTLEEPPAHVKFVFATTEIRKVPVTVLSRCQRFDLKRIDAERLQGHLAAIAEKENAKIDDAALGLIARAAEGSVRDALSLLDQAIVQHGAGDAAVSAEDVRDMLGLADRSRIWDLVDHIFKGDAAAALDEFKSQYDAGADPATVVRDVMEVTHLLSRVKAAPAAAAHGPAGAAEAERAEATAEKLKLPVLARAWSMLLKGLSEAQAAPSPAAAVDMLIIRLCYMADLPTPDEAIRMVQAGGGAGASGAAPSAHAPPGGAPGPAAAAPAKPQLATFKDLVRLAGSKRDLHLKQELETYVHLVAFEQGRIEFRPADGAPADLAGRLSRRLQDWTGDRWVVSVAARAGGEDTLRSARDREVMNDPLVQKALELFPGAQIDVVRDLDLPPAPESAENVLNEHEFEDDDLSPPQQERAP
ncbi:MAG: DNA polymerase III subunit gamma/tau [Pseudomonadota bacterium]